MSGKLLLMGVILQLAGAVLPGADGGASRQSRMRCGEEVGATLEGRTYAGVRGCAECTLDGSTTAVTCTRCAEGLYLKTDGGATSCVSATECPEGQFPTTDDTGQTICVLCGNTAKGGIANCQTCSPLTSASRSSTVLIKCTACSTGKKLSPLGDACLADCPYGSYEGSPNTCAPCHPLCASCNDNAGVDFCTACYPGYVLSRTDNGPIGKCIPECTEEFGANCETCTADIVGSKYCSKCKSGYVPVDGVCVPVTQRTISGCNPSEGICITCTAADYILLSGGCYNTQTFPAGFICTATDGAGKCTDCANGQNLDSSNNCPSCPVGCSRCAGSENSQTCSECLPGYYRSNNKCFKCTDSDTNGNPAITGIPNCVNCILLPGSSALTCYVKIDKGDDTKKSTFPAGAIAGISVAAVVVIGGLVGFLCWWFLCKTKRAGVSSSTTTLTRPTSS